MNQLMARKLLPLLKADDTIWVYDYHLIPMAAELRAMGRKNRIGFFAYFAAAGADSGCRAAARVADQITFCL